MKYINIANTDLNVSNLILGNMRLKQLSLADAEQLIRTAMEQNINFYDHADIYGGGECETHFAEAIGMNKSIREGMIIQSKCGIRSGFFDFSKEHIISSTENILKRLNTDYLDILLLHRPDALVEPEEVAEAFDQLHASGKVRYFGVSNHTPLQIELLKKHVRQKLVVNQLQLSVTHTPMIDSGITLNMNVDQAINRDSGVLDYCRLHDITVQAWSPFQKRFFDGPFLGDMENYGELNTLIDQLADKYGVTSAAIAVAWITRHPANIQVVLGTTNVSRLQDSCKGSDIPLTREEWYAMYRAGGKLLP
ncbi:aldo/keto reductase family oxidoreductase [Paenibacillus sp. GCM10027627]|uniref:aldo/keto reductase n=1 Tax=unclassified Paenibacillus TaxID=185978 RepID=UPI003630C249